MDREGAEFNRDGDTDWAFGELPRQVTTASGAQAWPALIDQQDAVGLRLFDTWEEAVHSHAGGVLRLLALKLADKAKYLRNHHGLEREALLAWSQTGSAEALVADLFWRSLLDTVAECRQQGVHDVRSGEAFAALLERVRSRLGVGDSRKTCAECGEPIPEARRAAVPGVRLCLPCQTEADERERVFSGYNRRGSKDSQLR